MGFSFVVKRTGIYLAVPLIVSMLVYKFVRLKYKAINLMLIKKYTYKNYVKFMRNNMKRFGKNFKIFFGFCCVL